MPGILPNTVHAYAAEASMGNMLRSSVLLHVIHTDYVQGASANAGQNLSAKTTNRTEKAMGFIS